MWQPLYQSEGPAQVFLLMLSWLIAAFGNKTRRTWKEVILAYDNMCHVNNLKVARNDLPLPGDLKYIWKDINKIIDSLHINNHCDPRCKTLYDPQPIKEKNPSFNTMACEQTFAWMSRFKKIVCSMPKTHHHFYIHRMVKRRNAYISYCYLHGRRPIHAKKLNTKE
ncbi:uncharacterized protein [Dysidea avara]|uniref:uncharacterized protein n=1 Tax=Dysidea avara TaxID=196820 RepID=UPI00331F6E70